MKQTSPLHNIHVAGLYGNYKNKNEKNLLKISEVKDLLIVQLVQYKNSSLKIDDLEIDSLKLKNKPLSVVSNQNTRIMWNSPKNWLVISSKKDLIKKISEIFKESDFAVTDLSHSRTIIDIEGVNAKEILKKGCPFDFNSFSKDACLNSIYNGIAFSADMIEENQDKIRLFTLRSFGESFYHSITDASLEFGYKAI
tara:strand:+ start:147 stop:734 length:588 start_codon:yes stop_codon:yes gene_type:complete